VTNIAEFLAFFKMECQTRNCVTLIIGITVSVTVLNGTFSGGFDRRQENRTSPWHQAGEEDQGGGTLVKEGSCWLHMCPPCCLLLVALKEYVVVFSI